MIETLVWISGATQGIGLGLAKNIPYANSKVINISRRKHPDFETVVADLTDPQSWETVCQDFMTRLSDFHGRRAIFIHNANFQDAGSVGPVGQSEQSSYRKSVMANCAAPLVLAEAFVRACLLQSGRPEFESGLVLLSSDSAALVLPGMATYCAAKVSAEHWVEVVRREQEAGGARLWAVAVRPGAVITPPVEAVAALSDEVYPGASRVRASLATRVTSDEAGRRIWATLPPPPGVSVISFGSHPTPDRQFGGAQVLMMQPA